MFEATAGLLDAAGVGAETASANWEEEAGVRASQWHVLVDLFNSPGGSSEAIRVFLARDLESCRPVAPHTGEAEEAHRRKPGSPGRGGESGAARPGGQSSAVAGILALAALASRDEGGPPVGE